MTRVLLNFGCGANLLPPPWRNLDLDRPDAKDRVDITKPLPFGEGSVDQILIEHCLEHVDSADGMRFLLEARRILRAGGSLRICVPVLDQLSIEEGRDICLNHGHRQIYSRESLWQFLRCAGFRSIRQTAWCETDGHRNQIGVDKDERETLRMEALK